MSGEQCRCGELMHPGRGCDAVFVRWFSYLRVSRGFVYLLLVSMVRVVSVCCIVFFLHCVSLQPAWSWRTICSVDERGVSRELDIA
ncbi:hypothetical protein CSKR_100439 [Clonorchis sinensis]|nr:hypothetical protein CSKR_100439 [Clonorchis sinensis]